MSLNGIRAALVALLISCLFWAVLIGAYVVGQR